MAINGHPEFVQFPQPSRPIQADQSIPEQIYCSFCDQEPPTMYTKTATAAAAGDGDSNAVHDDDDHVFKIFIGSCLEELDDKTHQVLKKLVAKVDRKTSFKRFIREHEQKQDQDHFEGKRRKIMDLFEKFNVRVKVSDPTVQERGVVDDIEFDQKLERFKVKTVNLGGGGGGDGDGGGGGGGGGVNESQK